MGQESGRTLASQQALRDQIPPSTVAGLLRMAGRDLASGDPSGTEAPVGPGAVTGARPGETAGARPGETAGAQPGETARAQPGAVTGTQPGETARAQPGETARAQPGENAGAQPAETAGDGPEPETEYGTASETESETRLTSPSWARVLATTVRLWVRRRRHGERETAPGRRLMIGLIVLVIAILVASGLIVALTRHATTTGPAPTGKGPASGQGSGALDATANIRRETATWVADQVSPSAIVACDPVMCAALQAKGLAAQNLLTLQPAASDPLGSDVVVATAAVRSQFGSRLASVFAPTVIATFGSGAARIDVRAVAPDGTAAYEAALGSDRLARLAAGSQLLGNPQITAEPAAGRELAGGHVDSRLLIVLAAVAARYHLNIAAFGTPAPGASPAVPLRSVDINGTGKDGGAELASVLAFLQAQLPPYRPMRAQVQGHGGAAVLRVDFGAPSPLGLLGTHA